MSREEAIHRLKSAIINKAVITALVATDAAESERSVVHKFSVEESDAIFTAALARLDSAPKQK